jgi:hypothetical protein
MGNRRGRGRKRQREKCHNEHQMKQLDDEFVQCRSEEYIDMDIIRSGLII